MVGFFQEEWIDCKGLLEAKIVVVVVVVGVSLTNELSEGDGNVFILFIILPLVWLLLWMLEDVELDGGWGMWGEIWWRFEEELREEEGVWKLVGVDWMLFILLLVVLWVGVDDIAELLVFICWFVWWIGLLLFPFKLVGGLNPGAIPDEEVEDNNEREFVVVGGCGGLILCLFKGMIGVWGIVDELDGVWWLNWELFGNKLELVIGWSIFEIWSEDEELEDEFDEIALFGYDLSLKQFPKYWPKSLRTLFLASVMACFWAFSIHSALFLLMAWPWK